MGSPDDHKTVGSQKSGPDGRVEPGRSLAEDEYLLVRCGVCNLDISRVCHAFNLPTAPRVLSVVMVPLRCPECQHPLVRRPPGSAVVIAAPRIPFA